MMEFSTKEVSNAIEKARKSITVRGWTREDLGGDALTDKTVQEFAGYVISHYGKAILEALIADKATEEARSLVIAEHVIAGIS